MEVAFLGEFQERYPFTYFLNVPFIYLLFFNLRFDSSHAFFNGAIHFFILFLTVSHSMWDLSILTRDRTCTPCSGSTESLESTTGPIWKVPGNIVLTGAHQYIFERLGCTSSNKIDAFYNSGTGSIWLLVMFGAFLPELGTVFLHFYPKFLCQMPHLLYMEHLQPLDQSIGHKLP